MSKIFRLFWSTIKYRFSNTCAWCPLWKWKFAKRNADLDWKMHDDCAVGWCPIFSCIFWLKNEVWGELRNRYFPVCPLKNTRDFTVHIWTGRLKIILNARGCVAFSSKVTFHDYVARIFMVPIISFRLNWKVKWLYKITL